MSSLTECLINTLLPVSWYICCYRNCNEEESITHDLCIRFKVEGIIIIIITIRYFFIFINHNL